MASDEDELEEAELEDILRPDAFYEDHDPGPQQIWELSREQDVTAIYEPLDWMSRKWGYAMWDSERLQALDAFDGTWHPAMEEEPRFYAVSDAEMRKSYDRRAAVYQKAGLSLWSEKDLSHIVWPSKRNDKPIANLSAVSVSQ
jgi:hypothetical protein